ncbi:hypothetical protein H6P81_013113 [Aristolochia fimbriata]|uniref:Retrotransposon gag domain-containing protein n=1 Tax=Aristolochia fimbriata TaxID=158543 RepID=A0AAV7EDQ9_ARIFI|nr:hypothetical protein H6P81_013113 [Aristolochia fimbriata]
MRTSTAYNPAANGLAEAFNKTLCKILKKTIGTNKKSWDEKLPEALWAYRTSVRTPTQSTPFSLVYGAEAVLPLEVQLPSLRIAVEPGLCMKTRSGGEPLAEPDPEPERSLLNRRKTGQSAMEGQNQEEGAEKTMEHYVQSNPNAQRSAIVRPEVPSNFEIKPQILSMIQNNYQFGGLSQEDPNEHIEKFLEIYDTFRFKDVTNEVVWLRLFPFTLRDRAKNWYHTLPPESIRTWEELQRKFLRKYFPPAKTIKLHNVISNFMQEHDEQLYEAWERFKELLKKCPNHGIPLWMQIETFYNGITVSTRNLIDATAGGTMNKKTPNEVYELIEEMSSNMYQYPVERSARGRVAGIQNVDPIVALSNDPYRNTYNPGWRNHPNFSWSNNNQQPNTQQPIAQTNHHLDSKR